MRPGDREAVEGGLGKGWGSGWARVRPRGTEGIEWEIGWWWSEA